jgi:hypothetical protein
MMLSFFAFRRSFTVFALAATAAQAAPAQTSVQAPVQTPAAYRQDYQPRPAIWLLSDADTKIYLFGTIHILAPGFKWQSPELSRVVGEAQELVVEHYEPPAAAKAAGEDWESVRIMMLPRPVPILSRVPPDKRAGLKQAIARSEVPEPVFDHLQSWAAAMMMGLAHLLDGYGTEDPDDAPGVEDVLEETFREAAKPILSVEDSTRVLRAMNGLPADVQTSMLVEAAEETSQKTEDSAKDDHEWARGRIEAMSMDDMIGDFPDPLFDILIRKRNAAWTDWLVARLDKPGTVLFAVGAGHLAGRESVQAMLEKRGLKARRVS